MTATPMLAATSTLPTTGTDHRARRRTAAISAAVAAPTIAAAPAVAAAASVEPTNLRWVSARSMTGGVPSEFHSVDSCPATRPDGSPLLGKPTVTLFVALANAAGGFGTTFPVAADGSWTAIWTTSLAGVPHGRFTITATCFDVTFTGIETARYQPHTIPVRR